MSKLLGLIGFPLSHSFSKKYFTEKFEREGIKGFRYELFPIEKIEMFPSLVKSHPDLVGLNVTIPYKEKVIDYLDELDPAAINIGAVNTIKIKNGRLAGYNTDVYGFSITLSSFLEEESGPLRPVPKKALVLGTGGSSKAVAYVLQKKGIPFLKVSRDAEKGDLTYATIEKRHLEEYSLIVNTTPLGMAPNVETAPQIPYQLLTQKNFLYDLVYNPEKTVFLKEGNKKGSATVNGLQMLLLQAEKAWRIWRDE